MRDLLITGIGRLVTNDPHRDDLLGIVPDAAVAAREGRIVWAGPETELVKELRDLPEVGADGRAVIPGFVDSHTHLVFGGDRVDEFGRRMHGQTYEQIMETGGGIVRTVAATRDTPTNRLASDAAARARRMLGTGTTTVEIKSGYGLDLETELRMLEAARTVGDVTPIEVATTFLGAHVVPAEYRHDRAGYVRLVVEEMIPAVAGLVEFCDVFCDAGAFTVDEARTILGAAAAAGLRLRLHAEQLAHTGGAALGAELGAVSIDHLDQATDADIAAIAQAGSVAVLLPSVSLLLGTAPPPARRLWDGGVPVAVATDCNPGTSYVENMQLVIALATLTTGLTPEESLWAATRGGAMALRRPDHGWIRPGSVADLVMLDAESHLEIPYRPGTDLVRMVVKHGEVVVS